MDATDEELGELKISQEQMNETIRILELVSKADNTKARFKYRSKAWKRMFCSIGIIADTIIAGKRTDRRKKRYTKREHAKKSIAMFKAADISISHRDDSIDTAVKIGCYICKLKFPIKDHHEIYRSMCIPCGEFNLQKRNQTFDLTGKVAIVTGARVKIGFQVALKLLRANCFVIATTRFAADAQSRYSAQLDYDTWKSRLLLVRLELQSRLAIELFCSIISTRFSSIDILINNAAQTISRPREYYRDVISIEEANNNTDHLMCNEIAMSDHLLTDGSHHLLTDGPIMSTTFPEGVVDPKNDNQQLDLRTTNSWIQTLETAPVEELLQDLAVNCAAPFILIQRLTPLLSKDVRASHTSDMSLPYSSIINVSAVEGMFNVHNKSSRHPSSNMAKAAFNMVTRTAGESYWKKYRIAMNSVDTGLVTNEFPASHSLRNLDVPLDEIDGAARILDPIFCRCYDVTYGVLLKDYEPVDW